MQANGGGGVKDSPQWINGIQSTGRDRLKGLCRRLARFWDEVLAAFHREVESRQESQELQERSPSDGN
jgi:hypothetical protein